MKPCPCKGCTQRSPACWSRGVDKYLPWKAELDEINNRRKQKACTYPTYAQQWQQTTAGYWRNQDISRRR